jgi:hypothetical protein
MKTEYFTPLKKKLLTFLSVSTLNQTKMPIIIYLHKSGEKVFSSENLARDLTLAHYVLNNAEKNKAISKGLEAIKPECILVSAGSYKDQRISMWFLGSSKQSWTLSEETDIFLIQDNIYVPMQEIKNQIPDFYNKTIEIFQREIKKREKAQDITIFLEKRPNLKGSKNINGIHTKSIELLNKYVI